MGWYRSRSDLRAKKEEIAEDVAMAEKDFPMIDDDT